MSGPSSPRNLSPNIEVADAVDAERLWRRHMAMAEIGATGRGGLNRQALTPEDADARILFGTWARERGLELAMDGFANFFVRLPGEDPEAAPVVTGSHLDTQPTGGKYDGIFGVLAGLEAVEAILDAGKQPRRPIEVVVWTNEEGARFQPSCMGSGVFAGALELDAAKALEDVDGVSLSSALAATLERVGDGLGDVSGRTLGFRPHAYVEAHIEQGPVLEQLGKTIGVVTGIQAMRWFEIEVTGQESHAGTTPRSARRDALVAAMDIVGAARRAAIERDPADVLRLTVGRFIVEPGSPNTVPGRVRFTIDLRHPDDAVVAEMAEEIQALTSELARPCSVEVRETSQSAAVAFAGPVRQAIERAAEALSLPYNVMPSGAGHDAQHLAAVCPTGMIFVPCEDGLSHNEAESAEKDDLAAGARVLAHALVELAETS